MEGELLEGQLAKRRDERRTEGETLVPVTKRSGRAFPQSMVGADFFQKFPPPEEPPPPTVVERQDFSHALRLRASCSGRRA